MPSSKATLGLLLALSTPALAEPVRYLKADGMWGHVGRAVAKPGEHVIRVKVFGAVRETDRSFLALTGGPKGRRYIWGSVHAPTGEVTTTKIEQAP